MTLAEMLYAIGAVLTGVGGIVLIVRELQRRERRAADRQIDTLSKQVQALREDSVEYHRWAFDLAEQMADKGLDVPKAPAPHDLAEPDDPVPVRKRR